MTMLNMLVKTRDLFFFFYPFEKVVQRGQDWLEGFHPVLDVGQLKDMGLLQNQPLEVDEGLSVGQQDLVKALAESLNIEAMELI